MSRLLAKLLARSLVLCLVLPLSYHAVFLCQSYIVVRVSYWIDPKESLQMFDALALFALSTRWVGACFVFVGDDLIDTFVGCSFPHFGADRK